MYKHIVLFRNRSRHFPEANGLKTYMFGKSKITFELKFRIVIVYMIHTDMFSYDAIRIQLHKDKHIGNSER